MKKSLENKIFKKYPLLFPNGRNVNPKESLICFGIETGDGWFDLINDLCESIMIMCPDSPPVVEQVKEKFGGLRFYINKGSNEVFNVIHYAENKSYTICETCGKQGKLRNGVWFRTECNDCNNKRKLDEQKRQEAFRKNATTITNKR
jgi:hypothetical protein